MMDRFKFLDPAGYLNPVAQIFFFITLVHGIAFTAFGWTASVKLSVLYSLTAANLGFAAVPLWGVMLLLVAVLNTGALLAKKYSLARTAAFLGFLTWLYAAVAYVFGGAWYQMLAAAVPNMVFWVWFYFAVSKYDRTGESRWLIGKRKVQTTSSTEE